MKYEYKTKPKKCPVCDSKTIADIQYGLPVFSEELNNDLEAGKVVLGGCVISGDDPTWKCVVCGAEFYQKITK